VPSLPPWFLDEDWLAFSHVALALLLLLVGVVWVVLAWRINRRQRTLLERQAEIGDAQAEVVRRQEGLGAKLRDVEALQQQLLDASKKPMLAVEIMSAALLPGEIVFTLGVANRGHGGVPECQWYFGISSADAVACREGHTLVKSWPADPDNPKALRYYQGQCTKPIPPAHTLPCITVHVSRDPSDPRPPDARVAWGLQTQDREWKSTEPLALELVW
jgi:hypothetical protein